MDNKKFSNLVPRLITGILGSAGIIFGVVYSEWLYFLVFFIIVLFSLLEFYKLAGLDGLVPQKTFGVACGIVIYCLSFFIQRGTLPGKYYFLFFPLVSSLFIIKLYKQSDPKPFTNIAITFLGIFYTAVPFALINVAVFEDKVYNYEIILGSLLIHWATDTGAYFAGTFFGRRKLFKRISPKKSWEGFAGGVILAMVFAYGASFYFVSLAQWQWLCVGWIIIIGGTYGDLVESLLKRSIAIKDSGDSLPGHGGFLDRFDGLFISAPFIVAFLEVF